MYTDRIHDTAFIIDNKIHYGQSFYIDGGENDIDTVALQSTFSEYDISHHLSKYTFNIALKLINQSPIDTPNNNLGFTLVNARQ